MSMALIVAALLVQRPEMVAPQALTSPPPPAGREEGLGDTERLYRLQRDVAAAQAQGRIDEAEAKDFNLAIARIRRQIIRMGIQVGVRQRQRVRARIDGVRARLDARLAAGSVRSGN
ncbi:MAG TPA: hypothetical protein VF718_01065 [Allosphingosinicella sp.]|jgi:hypothetical protein